MSDAVSTILTQTPEQKLAELQRELATLKNLNARLEQKLADSQLESGIFKNLIASAAHDIQAPLSSNDGFTNLAARALEKSGDVKKALEYLARAKTPRDRALQIFKDFSTQIQYDRNGVILDVSE